MDPAAFRFDLFIWALVILGLLGALFPHAMFGRVVRDPHWMRWVSLAAFVVGIVLGYDRYSSGEPRILVTPSETIDREIGRR